MANESLVIYSINKVGHIIPPQTDPARHFARLLLRHQDRRSRSERRRQIHPTSHHGRHRQGLQRRELPIQRLHCRLARALR